MFNILFCYLYVRSLYMLLLYKLFFVFIIPTKVYINIEKPNPIITHAGITFENYNEKIRYDFRAFNNNTDYINILSDGKKYSIKAKINDSFEIIETPENRDQILETLKDELSKIEKYFDKVDIDIKDQMNKQNEKVSV